LWAVDVAEPLPRLPLANAQKSIRPRHDHVRVAAKDDYFMNRVVAAPYTRSILAGPMKRMDDQYP
jgi:hypothetical protein